MDFKKLYPGDIIGLSAKIKDSPKPWQWVGLWKNRKSFETAEKCSAAILFGPAEDFMFRHGDLILVTKVKHNKSVVSYVEGYSLTLRRSVWFPIGGMVDDRLFKVVSKAPRS